MYYQRSLFFSFQQNLIPSSGTEVDKWNRPESRRNSVNRRHQHHKSVNNIDQSINFSDAIFVPKLGNNLVSAGSITAKVGEICFVNAHVNVIRDCILQLVGTRAGATLNRLDTKAPYQSKNFPKVFSFSS
jgi:hypothetical protein